MVLLMKNSDWFINDVPKDKILTSDDVILPVNRVADKLCLEQIINFLASYRIVLFGLKQCKTCLLIKVKYRIILKYHNI